MYINCNSIISRNKRNIREVTPKRKFTEVLNKETKEKKQINRTYFQALYPLCS
jgi:hypothetical protein